MALKDWKKTYNSIKDVVFTNVNKQLTITVSENWYPNKKTDWQITFTDFSDSNIPHYILTKYKKTKEEALTLAKKLMKIW